MRNRSWEIITAGLLFIGVSIYIINSQNEPEPAQAVEATPDSVRIQITDNKVKVIELSKLAALKNLESLKDLKNLENLEALENLENLENLRIIGNYLPAEIKEEYLKEVEKALQKLEGEDYNIDIDLDKSMITVETIKELKKGAWNPVTPGVYTFVKAFDAADIKNASLNIPFGSIDVVGTEGTEAELILKASGKISSAEELEQKLKTMASISGTEARFNVQSDEKRNPENLLLQATLEVPAATHLQMVTQGGHISSTNITGKQSYKTEGGHLTLSKLRGEIEAVTRGGHISISNTDADVNANTSGGHINTKNSSGNFVLHTSGGNIKGENITGGRIDLFTSGGNIEFSMTELSDTFSAKTNAGTIYVIFPDQLQANLSASGSSVELDSGFEFTGSSSKSNYDGKIGEGGLPVKLNAHFGKVVIKAD